MAPIIRARRSLRATSARQPATRSIALEGSSANRRRAPTQAPMIGFSRRSRIRPHHDIVPFVPVLLTHWQFA